MGRGKGPLLCLLPVKSQFDKNLLLIKKTGAKDTGMYVKTH